MALLTHDDALLLPCMAMQADYSAAGKQLALPQVCSHRENLQNIFIKLFRQFKTAWGKIACVTDSFRKRRGIHQRPNVNVLLKEGQAWTQN